MSYLTINFVPLLLIWCFIAMPTTDALIEIGRVYSGNTTLFMRDGPYQATSDIVIQPSGNLSMQEGVEIKFAPGIGIVNEGILHAVGNEFLHIKFTALNDIPKTGWNITFPDFRVVDGPSVRVGRLQTYYNGLWRSVCTMNTNWTIPDFNAACRSIGYENGNFFRYFRRNNDTRPFVMPKPGCSQTARGLVHCSAWTPDTIRLGENLCQGEDDVGIECWGRPIFSGSLVNWMGIYMSSNKYHEEAADEWNGIEAKKVSESRIEWVDIEYAGYSRKTRNITSAIYAQGIPPVMNFVNILYSAGDGIRVYEAFAPVQVTNSTIEHNRGHGIVVVNSTDGRLFVNQTRIRYNFGDGVQYSTRQGLSRATHLITSSRIIDYAEPEKPRENICNQGLNPRNNKNPSYYPKLIEALLLNGTMVDPSGFPCQEIYKIPGGLDYRFTVQFVQIINLNPESIGTKTEIVICNTGAECEHPAFAIPIYNGIYPPSVSLPNVPGRGIWIGMNHTNLQSEKTIGTVRVVMRIHAQVKDQIVYGLNVSNSRIEANLGKGIFANRIRDRTVINNVSLSNNQYLAGFHCLDGAGDIWVNNTDIYGNWGDGINVTYVGGSILINSTNITYNWLRGAAFHYNSSSMFMPLSQKIEFKGRLANTDLMPTIISGNRWGGILVGNFCANAHFRVPDPKVAVSYVTLRNNSFHPSFEYHSCQRDDQSTTNVAFIGSQCHDSASICFRIKPAVNIHLRVTDNDFHKNSRQVMIIRNREHPQLSHLPARVEIEHNKFISNTGPYVANVGLNEDAPLQSMVLQRTNQFSDNTVVNPYPYLNPRNRPFAVLIVSSSNTKLNDNCFDNKESVYELASDLAEHAKVIDATRNQLIPHGRGGDESYLYSRLFDKTKRYNLAKLNIDPYNLYCNLVHPGARNIRVKYPPFSSSNNRLGGYLLSNTNLAKGNYVVENDIQILPGASLAISPGTNFEFEDSIGMLVQGQLERTNYGSYSEYVTFTYKKFEFPPIRNIRLVNENEQESTSGRLEVRLDSASSDWGTVCNRSWSIDLASMVCHQLGLVLDPEFLENWWTFPSTGNLPIVMDIIRCQEEETDITQCWFDSVSENVNQSCRPMDVVGVRCVEPRWAGVRYTMLADSPSTTGQQHMHHWIVERAGLFDYWSPLFSPALQIDWNHYSLSNLVIRDNFWNGIDIVYNDPVVKAKLSSSQISGNRRHGIRLRSHGITMDGVQIKNNENAGVRYNPILSKSLQKDIVTWLAQVPNHNRVQSFDSASASTITLSNLNVNGVFFLASSLTPGKHRITVIADSHSSRIGIMIVNRPNSVGGETLRLMDGGNPRAAATWDIPKDLIDFPRTSTTNQVGMDYTWTHGPAQLVLFLFYKQMHQYLTPFIHMRSCSVIGNQYGVSTLHYSTGEHSDGSVINRYRREQIWFQKTEFSQNKQAVIWVNGPLRDVYIGSPIAEMEYYIDNCSIANNYGSIIETHRDLHQSANVFTWRVWRSTFQYNNNSGFSVALPATYDLKAEQHHIFMLTESRFQENNNFEFVLDGYYAWVNISANNFTNNRARPGDGLMRFSGMEKSVVMERNRFSENRGNYMLLYDAQSQTIRRFNNTATVPASIHRNDFTNNFFVTAIEDLIDNFPRSFALGILGSQKVNISRNNFKNDLMDFEVVCGLRAQRNLSSGANLTYNWWGAATATEVPQRVFDFDDWNVYSIANYNPYWVSHQPVDRWDWRDSDAQIEEYYPDAATADNLHGRVYGDLHLKRQQQKWTDEKWRNRYKPDKPYIIRKDITIMPGATLTLDPGVEMHLYPNVRILVLGDLVAEGTEKLPIRFRPVNVTELKDLRERLIATWSNPDLQTSAGIDPWLIPVGNGGRKRRYKRDDIIYRKFPLLRRQDSFYQQFQSYLLSGFENGRSGYLEIWNATTGQMVPICDKQFTRRNAEVVCRELGFPTQNVYTWIGARWDYDPKVRIVRQYSEPRKCTGREKKLSECDLRLTGHQDLWYCTDSEHFVYIHCGKPMGLTDPQYIRPWGGITFSSLAYSGQALKQHYSNLGTTDNRNSRMKNVEILGAGFPHGEIGSALELIFRSPILTSVNVTNSSMHALNIIAPTNQVSLTKINITNNLGIGLNILTLSLQDDKRSFPLVNASYPYHMFGMVDFCSFEKEVLVEDRVLVYYKYDSYSVDCVKIFRTMEGSSRTLVFNFLQFNLYNSHDDIGRPDVLKFYNGDRFDPSDLKVTKQYDSEVSSGFASIGSTMGVLLQANAADGIYGFIAEVVTKTITAPSHLTSVDITNSRFENNDRGAIHYNSMGQESPTISVDKSMIALNGFHIFANFSSSRAAAMFQLHNSRYFRFDGNTVWKNQGGLHVFANGTSPIASMQGYIFNSAFSENEWFETLKLEGYTYQSMQVVNNYFGKNYCPHYDVILVDRIMTNFLSNFIHNNTGTHICDITGYAEFTEFMSFADNKLTDNRARGHGYFFNVTYGYGPSNYYDIAYQNILKSETMANRRRKREINIDSSFEWWANVGAESERYRSTILVGTGRQEFKNNYFVNPLNDFELTTVNKTSGLAYKGPVDARSNWWGYDRVGAAAGRIRDKGDYSYLLEVDYDPILRSNTTLLSSDCPAGWFFAGQEKPTRIKSCFMYVGGALDFHQASRFCIQNGGFMPYFRNMDPRLDPVVDHLRGISLRFQVPSFQFANTEPNEIKVWVSGVMIPAEKCGVLSSDSGTITNDNCEGLLAFICEQGDHATSGPFWYTPAGISVFVIAVVVVLIIILLVILWARKSKLRKRQFFERKNSYRASLRSIQLQEKAKKEAERNREFHNTMNGHKPPRPPSPDLITDAYRNMLLTPTQQNYYNSTRGGTHGVGGGTPPQTSTPKSGSLVRLARDKESRKSLSSVTTTTTAYESEHGSPEKKRHSPSSSYTESAYRSDYTSSQNTQYLSDKYNQGQSKIRSNRDVAPSLSSFQSPQKQVEGSSSDIYSSMSGHYTVNSTPAASAIQMRNTPKYRPSDLSNASSTITDSSTASVVDGSRVSYDPRGYEVSVCGTCNNRNSTETGTSYDSDGCSTCRSSYANHDDFTPPPPPPLLNNLGASESSLNSSIDHADSSVRLKPGGANFRNGADRTYSEDCRDYIKGHTLNSLNAYSKSTPFSTPKKTPPLPPSRPPARPPGGALAYPVYSPSSTSHSHDSLSSIVQLTPANSRTGGLLSNSKVPNLSSFMRATPPSLHSIQPKGLQPSSGSSSSGHSSSSTGTPQPLETAM